MSGRSPAGRRGTVNRTIGPLLWSCLVCLVSAMVAGQAGASAPDQRLSFTVVDTLGLPKVGAVAGLTWIGPDTLAVLTDIPDTLSASGKREVQLVFQDTAGQVLHTEDFTGVLDRGLTYDGEFLWSCGDAGDGSSLLYKIKVDTLRIEEAYDTPGHRPSGMCWDGRFLWISDRDAGRVDRFDPEAEEVTRTAVTPGFSPFGIAMTQGRHMWVADSGSGRLYRLTGARRRWTATVNSDSFLQRGQDVLLLDDGISLWYVPPGQNFAVRVQFP